MNGPGAKAGLLWSDIAYPKGDENDAGAAKHGADVIVETQQVDEGKLVKLRIPRRTWTDDVVDAAAAGGGGE